jgi:hypothetical protein
MSSSSDFTSSRAMILHARSMVQMDLYQPGITYIRLPAYTLHPLPVKLAHCAGAFDATTAIESHWNSFASLAIRWLSPARTPVYSTPANA